MREDKSEAMLKRSPSSSLTNFVRGGLNERAPNPALTHNFSAFGIRTSLRFPHWGFRIPVPSPAHLIGFVLVLEGAHIKVDGDVFEVPKGYIYFAMAFAFCVEMLNLRIRSRGKRGKTTAHHV